MNQKTRYDFKEALLGPNFKKDFYQEVQHKLNTNTSFTIIGLPSVGVSFFLRFLATTDLAFFVFVDLYTLPSLSKRDFFKLILKELGGEPINTDHESDLLLSCQEQLKKLAADTNVKKIVLILNRFDQLKAEFDRNLFLSIKSLKNIAPDKIVIITTATKPLQDINPEALGGGNINFYAPNLYFKPYFIQDLKKVFELYNPTADMTSSKITQALELSGGHNQLLQLLIKSEWSENLLYDKFVNTQIKELYEYLPYNERKQLQKIAFGKTVTSLDPFLIEIGLVKTLPKGEHKLLSPLLEDYIKQHTKLKLPAKEAKVFTLLRKNLERVVSKDLLFNTLWPNNPEKASEWALNALIYRLRKNQVFTRSGYYIENHKKIGYIMYKT